MTQIADIFHPDHLARMETEGYVRRTHHPHLPLSILNYTAAAQYSREWNDVTLNCRGLIVDHAGAVVARGFPKFFNLTEHNLNDERLTWPFTISEKVDGSLGIFWCYDGETGVATRGSFTSDQAMWATDWLHRHHPGFDWPPGTTPLFEIIYQANRIVVDYQNLEGLVFLGLLDNATGHTVKPHPVFDRFTPAAFYRTGTCTPHEVCDVHGVDDGNHEGFVLTFHGPGEQLRVKAKLSEYVRLHALITESSTKTVWRALAAGIDPTAIAEAVPDEFYAWLKGVVETLRGSFEQIEREAREEFERIAPLAGDRKAFAEEAVKSPHRGLLFAMLDGKPVAPMIWRQLQPAYERPFFTQSEDVA